MQHPLQCRCGTIKGWVNDTESANRVVCYCRDCQAFARFLGQESETLDAQGGSDVVQTLPKNVTFTQGSEALACMRLSAKGMGRTIWWFAGTVLKARVNGDYRQTPFFKDGRPVAIPHVISSAERASAMQSQAR